MNSVELLGPPLLLEVAEVLCLMVFLECIPGFLLDIGLLLELTTPLADLIFCLWIFFFRSSSHFFIIASKNLK